MKMSKINIGLSIFFLLFGIAILVITPLEVTAVSSAFNGMVPSTFPKFVGWFAIVMSVCEFIDTLLHIKNKTDEEEFEERDKKREGKVLLIFLLMILYTCLCGILGFFFASVVFVVAFLALMGVKQWWNYAIAIVACFIIFYAFRYMLYIHLPRIKLWIF